MLSFMFDCFSFFAVAEILRPMLCLIAVFGIFRLGYFIFIGGWNNE